MTFSRGAEPHLSHHHGFTTANDELYGRANTWKLNSHVTQHFRSNAFALAHKAQKQMFGPNVVVIEPLSFFLGERKDSASSIGKLVELLGHPGSHSRCGTTELVAT